MIDLMAWIEVLWFAAAVAGMAVNVLGLVQAGIDSTVAATWPSDAARRDAARRNLIREYVLLAVMSVSLLAASTDLFVSPTPEGLRSVVDGVAFLLITVVLGVYAVYCQVDYGRLRKGEGHA